MTLRDRTRANRSGRSDGRNPARLIAGSFALIIVIGAALLSLPIASASGQATPLLTALFTAVSATCVTGLIMVDTATHYSTFGQVVILVLIQIGGTGVMTLATMIGVVVTRRIGLRMETSVQTENKAFGAGDVRDLVGRIAIMTVAIEAVIAAVLTIAFARTPGIGPGRAVYAGVFHSVSAFNNAGFSIFSDNLVGYVGDPLVCIPVMAAIILGGIGFPVLVEIQRLTRGRRRRLGVHASITLGTTAVLLVVGSVGFLITEWGNPRTLGALSLPQQVLAAVFGGVVPRTAGFNSLDVAHFRPATLLLNDILMFIGGGSAGTAGGIKVTTFALLAFVVWAELRGEPTVHVRHRRLPEAVQRQALAVVLLAVGVIIASTLVIMVITPFSMAKVLFEVISAFATVGLSAGLTPKLPVLAHCILMMLMFVGRLGPITLGSALALRDRRRRYELPEERPLVG